MSTENTLNPLEVTEYIQLTGEIIHEQEQKIASLSTEVSDSRRALEKSAAETRKTVNEESVLKVMQKLAKSRPTLLGESPAVAATKAVQDPEYLLSVMDKMAGDVMDMQVTKLGSSILQDDAMPKSAKGPNSIVRESDAFLENAFLG